MAEVSERKFLEGALWEEGFGISVALLRKLTAEHEPINAPR